jgi:hypothetical protein
MKQGSDSVTTVIRPTFKPTAEQLSALQVTQEMWDQRDRAEDQAWKATQHLRDLGIPDLVICEHIRQVSKPTLNRKLGPRKAKDES